MQVESYRPETLQGFSLQLQFFLNFSEFSGFFAYAKEIWAPGGPTRLKQVPKEPALIKKMNNLF